MWSRRPTADRDRALRQRRRFTARGAARLLAACLLAGAVAACGFQPLYGETDAGGPGRLAAEVAPIAEREGQIMRARLRRAFDRSRPAEYRLQVKTRERIERLATDREGDVIRRRMIIVAAWSLARLDDPAEAPPLTGEARAVEAFNVLASDFANVTAERAARERAAARLAEMIAIAATARARREAR